MSIFRKEGGFMDVIRCDEPDYLIWKWRPEGSDGPTKRENAIRWGSNLTVRSGSLAVFVYKGQHEYISGPYSGKLSTANLPVIARIVGLAYDGGSPFPAEVYFVNLAKVIQIRFAVPYFDVFDPIFNEFSVPVAVRGTITFELGDVENFISLHRLDQFDLDSFSQQIRDAVAKYVKFVVANMPSERDFFVLQLDKHIDEINMIVDAQLKTRLFQDFGVIVTETDIGTIDYDTSSEGYEELLHVTRDVTTANIEAQTAANVKNIADMQRINAENYEDTLRRNREEDQYARHLNTQASNINVHTINQQAAVGIAGAEGIGHMGSGGSGGGGDSGGFNPAAMMAGMAIGGAFGQNIAGMVNSSMNPNNQQTSPPPIPQTLYHVAVNGQATGPFDMNVIRQMCADGAITKDTLLWKSGMAEWKKAGDIDEINSFFGNIPPVPRA